MLVAESLSSNSAFPLWFKNDRVGTFQPEAGINKHDNRRAVLTAVERYRAWFVSQQAKRQNDPVANSILMI